MGFLQVPIMKDKYFITEMILQSNLTGENTTKYLIIHLRKGVGLNFAEIEDMYLKSGFSENSISCFRDCRGFCWWPVPSYLKNMSFEEANQIGKSTSLRRKEKSADIFTKKIIESGVRLDESTITKRCIS